MAKGQLSTERISHFRINERKNFSEDQSSKRRIFYFLFFFFLNTEGEYKGEKKEANVLSDNTRERVGTKLPGSRKFFKKLLCIITTPHFTHCTEGTIKIYSFIFLDVGSMKWLHPLRKEKHKEKVSK